MEGKDTSWRKAHFYTPEFINDHRCFGKAQTDRERMSIAKSCGDSFSCQHLLPVRRESCLGIFLPAFSELKTTLSYASTFAHKGTFLNCEDVQASF